MPRRKTASLADLVSVIKDLSTWEGRWHSTRIDPVHSTALSDLANNALMGFESLVSDLQRTAPIAITWLKKLRALPNLPPGKATEIDTFIARLQKTRVAALQERLARLSKA